jgi:lipopolysaccharide transport system permease protein
MLNSKFHIYTAESRVKELRSLIREMLSGLISGRYLAIRLFLKDIRADYSRSKFGVLWDFLEPIILAIIFIFLRRGNVINSGDISIPYSVYVVYGLLLWQTFSESITSSLGILQRSKTLLNQVKFPPESLLVSVFLKVGFNSLFRIVVMLLISIFISAFSLQGFVLFIILYPSLILVGMAIGVFLAPFNVIYNDIGKFVKISLRPLMYASPVLWAATPVSFLGVFNNYNPFGIVLTNLRSLATQGIFLESYGFLITVIASFIILILSWFIFHLSIPLLAHEI